MFGSSQPKDDVNLSPEAEEYLAVVPDSHMGDQMQGEDTHDGGTIVTIGEAKERREPSVQHEFYANLAEILSERAMDSISVELLRKVEQDKDARADRDKQQEDGLRRTGLGKDSPGGAQFEGASIVAHPMLTEACIDYAARIMKEVFPIAGPVKERIIGKPTAEKQTVAERKCAHMNWQLTVQIKEARSVFEQMFTQVPLGGVQYVLLWQDHRLKRPRMQMVPIDNVYLPFSAVDFQSSHRRTWTDIIPDVEFHQRVSQGMYRDAGVSKLSSEPEVSGSAKANMKIEGKEATGLNIDNEREVYNTMSYLDVSDDMEADLGGQYEKEGDLLPYLVTIDVSSGKILSIYRDWAQDDHAHEPIDHLFEFPFIPWRGAQAIGLPQIIGGLATAATGALRALLDSAHASNAITGFILKGSGISGQSRAPNIGELVEITGGLEADDIRKRIMAPPFNPPNPVLFQLLGFLVDTAKGTVRTSMDDSQNPNANVPVGTQLARLEEGLTVFSAIHGRTHAALNRFLMGLHRLNSLYLPDQLSVDREGSEALVLRSDYDGPCDVQPVSDPTIYSDQQRFYQIAALEQAAMQFPNLYDVREIQKRKLKLWKIPDADLLLKKEPKIDELNAVNENLRMALGQPVGVFPEQDHLAHMEVILQFVKNPMLGSNPLIAPAYLPLALKHAAEHMVFYYVTHVVEACERAAQTDPSKLMSDDPGLKRLFDQLLAQACTTTAPEIAQILGPAQQSIQQAMQMLTSMAKQPPMDPSQAALQAAGVETQRKSADDQATNAIAMEKLRQEGILSQQENAITWARVQADQREAALAAQAKLDATQADNNTALTISHERIASGKPGGFTTGGSLER